MTPFFCSLLSRSLSLRTIAISIITVLCHFAAAPQEIRTDSLPSDDDKSGELLLKSYRPLFKASDLELRLEGLSARPLNELSESTIDLHYRANSDYIDKLREAIKFTYPELRWKNGAARPFGSYNVIPGILASETVGFGIGQQVGNVSFMVSAYNRNYGMFRQVVSQQGISAEIGWQINSHFSLHGFGRFTNHFNNLNGTPGFFGNPVNRAGYLDSSVYGGYMRYTPDNKWGVDVGAQNMYNMATGRWEMSPIVRPYVKINNRDVIGVDVGSILYNFIKWNGGKKLGWGRSNPTMGPPIPMGPPPVR